MRTSPRATPRSISVECYAGYTANQEPRAIIIDGERRTVLGIAKRWREPGACWFEVRADDGHRYTMRFDEKRDAWTLVSVREASS